MNSKKAFNKKNLTIIALTTGLTAVVIFAVIVLAVYLNESSYGGEGNYVIEGVDVSYYQGDIDWNGLASEGISFAFIKATEGSKLVDPKFETNWKDARKHMLKVGAYHFVSYDSDGESQADNFIENVPKRFGTLPPVVDVEMYGKYRYKGQAPSYQLMYDTLDPLLKKLEDHYGKKPIIYTNNYIYNSYISRKYPQYDIWISDKSIPDTLDDGKEWRFCQYSFEGVSEYISDGKSMVDMNVFRGSKWDLRMYRGVR